MAQTTDETTNRKLKRLYKHADGEVNKKLAPDVTHVIIEPIGGTGRVEASLAALFGNQLPGPCIGLAAAAFGLNTVLGNAVAGNTGTADQLLAAIQERWEVIEDGEWSEGREGGPSLKYVLEAWAQYRAHRTKSETTPDQVETMRQHILSGEPVDGVVLTKKMLLDNDGVRAFYDANAAARLNEKAKAGLAKAEAAPQEKDPLLSV